MSAMAVYMLRSVIERVCEDWESKGLSVFFYCDELSNICGAEGAGSGELDVIASLKDIGRSRGVKLNLATQRMDQLPVTVRTVLSTMATKLYLRTESLVMATGAVHDLVGREIEGYSTKVLFTPEDIRNLAQFEGVLRVRVGDVAQPPFNVYLMPEDEFHVELVQGEVGSGGIPRVYSDQPVPQGKLSVPGLDYGSR